MLYKIIQIINLEYKWILSSTFIKYNVDNKVHCILLRYISYLKLNNKYKVQYKGKKP